MLGTRRICRRLQVNDEVLRCRTSSSDACVDALNFDNVTILMISGAGYEELMTTIKKHIATGIAEASEKMQGGVKSALKDFKDVTGFEVPGGSDLLRFINNAMIIALECALKALGITKGKEMKGDYGTKGLQKLKKKELVIYRLIILCNLFG